MLATRRAAVGAVLVAAASLSLPLAASAQPRALASPAAVTGEPVGGPALGSAGLVVKLGAGASALPRVDATSWLLADLTTGEVLAAKGAHVLVRPASTLKTLTALTLMPVLADDKVVEASTEATRADGSHVGIVAGATYTVDDLWHGMLLPSGNDAAMALADANGGLLPTIRAMQAQAIALGALDTTVKNPSGLDHPRQFTSAYDIALIAREAMKNPKFAEVTRTVSYDFPGKAVAAGAKRSTYKIYTQNRLLLHDFPGAVGGKTGFTTLARRTFWGAAERDGHMLVVTLFQNKQTTEVAAKALLTWGFANLAKITPVGTLVPPGSTSPSASPTASPGATGAPVGDGGQGGTTASASGTTSVSLGGRARTLLLPLLAVLVVGALAWWWFARRRAGSSATTTSTPTPTAARTAPDSALGTTPAAPHGDAAPAVPVAPVAPAARTTSSVTVVRPGAPAPVDPVPADVAAATAAPPTEPATSAASVASPSSLTPPVQPSEDLPVAVDDTAPVPVVTPPAAVRPPTSGNVRVVRPPSRD